MHHPPPHVSCQADSRQRDHRPPVTLGTAPLDGSSDEKVPLSERSMENHDRRDAVDGCTQSVSNKEEGSFR